MSLVAWPPEYVPPPLAHRFIDCPSGMSPDCATCTARTAALDRRSDRAGVIYYVLDTAAGLVKIGTTRNLGQRMTDLRRAADGHDLVLLAVHLGSYVDEAVLHERFADEQVRRGSEWFRYSDRLADHVTRAAAFADAVVWGIE